MLRIDRIHLNPNPGVIHLGLYSKKAYEAVHWFFEYLIVLRECYNCNDLYGFEQSSPDEKYVFIDDDGELYLRHVRYNQALDLHAEFFYEEMFDRWERFIDLENVVLPTETDDETLKNAKIIIKEMRSEDPSEEFKNLAGDQFNPFIIAKIQYLRNANASQEEIKKVIEDGWSSRS